MQLSPYSAIDTYQAIRHDHGLAGTAGHPIDVYAVISYLASRTGQDSLLVSR